MTSSAAMRSLAKPTTARRQPTPRGAASLIVVMLLFFLMALVAVYTSRNMIFEQRTSANQYRSSQAFEAAEAGLNWALAQLNGGRIDGACLPTNALTQTSFRARYIDNIDAQGRMTLKTTTPAGAPAVLLPSCIFDPQVNNWRCDCPYAAAPNLPTVTAAGQKPMFRVRLEYLPAAPNIPSNVIRIVSAGCSRADAACLAANPSAPPGDAIAVLSALVTLRSSLSTVPGAALTARLGVNGGTGSLGLTNLDAGTQGMTVLSGGAVSGVGVSVMPFSLPGTPPEESVGAGDDRLAGFRSFAGFSTGDRMFGAIFGMSPDTYRDQPGAVRLDCAAGCNAATVNTEAARNPGKLLWLNGDLTVDGNIGAAPTAGILATSELAAARPVMIVVTGNVTLSSGTLYGAVYSRSASWNRGLGSTRVDGALVAEGEFIGSGSQRVFYEPEILNELRTRSGTFVRVPGGWRDF